MLTYMPASYTYTLSLHDALPISLSSAADGGDLRAAYTRGGYQFLDDVVPDHRVQGRRRAQGTFALRSDAGKRSEEHTSELQSRGHLVCRLLLEKKNIKQRADESH